MQDWRKTSIIGTDFQYIRENNKKAGPICPCHCCLLLSGCSAFYAESDLGTPATPLCATPLTSRSGYEAEYTAVIIAVSNSGPDEWNGNGAFIWVIRRYGHTYRVLTLIWVSTNSKTCSFPSPDFSGFGFYFFLLSVPLLLNLRLLLSGPLYEEVLPFLRSLPERLSFPLLSSLIYGLFWPLFFEPDFCPWAVYNLGSIWFNKQKSCKIICL